MIAGATRRASPAVRAAFLYCVQCGHTLTLIATTYAPTTVLAWTGTDAAHHLNLPTSQDGLRYANKRILAEASLWRPAVAFIDSGRGAPYGARRFVSQPHHSRSGRAGIATFVTPACR